MTGLQHLMTNLLLTGIVWLLGRILVVLQDIHRLRK